MKRWSRNCTVLGAGMMLLAGALVGGATSAAAHVSGQADYTTIATGLNNPRHLSVTPYGAIFVAEAGTGGTGTCIPGAEGGQVCYGATGSITELVRSWWGHHWYQRRVVTGLPSLAGPGGASATGPSDVSVRGLRYVTSIGLGADPSVRAQLPDGFGTLLQGNLFWRHREPRVLADISAYEQANNPVDTVDSNPASVLRIGSRYLVADAGGNDVLLADSRGHVRLVAALQNTPNKPESDGGVQAVPTSAVIGPDHAIYISELTGAPFPVGGAKILRVVPGHEPTVYASGLTNVTDIAFGRDGSLYAVEIAANGIPNGLTGDLVRIPRGGGAHHDVVVDDLVAPYGVALHGGHAYVTTGSVLPGGGTVIRVDLPSSCHRWWCRWR